MRKQVMGIDSLFKLISKTFGSSKVLVQENSQIITIEPIRAKKNGCCSRVRGLLADCPDMSVDKFLERKHKDKALDL
jgi:hypothetical protein